MKNFKQQQHYLIEFEYASSYQLKLLSEYIDRSYIVIYRCHIVIMSLISHSYGD